MLPDRGRGERGEGRKNGTAKYLRGIRGRDPSPTGTCVRRGAEHSTRGACAPRTLNTPSHRMGEGKRSRGRRDLRVGAKDACRTAKCCYSAGLDAEFVGEKADSSTAGLSRRAGAANRAEAARQAAAAGHQLGNRKPQAPAFGSHARPTLPAARRRLL